MGKILTWILGFTKFGKLNEGLKGYRSSAIALAAALGASATIIVNLTDKGLPYLANLMGSGEFQTASGAWVAFFLALKGMRIEKKVEENTAITEAAAMEGK